MLKKFSVKGFKSFPDMLTLDLESKNNYEYNPEVIKDGLVNKGIIYGFNGCGKSNLGLAIFDIIILLTDKHKGIEDYYPYHNLDIPQKEPVEFEYTFLFEDSELVYRYEKKGIDSLVNEYVSIDGKECIRYDFVENTGYVRLKGAENLQISDSGSGISRVRFVRNNCILENTHENSVFKEFLHFVDNMLMFYSLETNRFRGLNNSPSSISAAIIESGRIQDFEGFLHENHIDMNLESGEEDGYPVLYAKYNNTRTDFFKVASTGTKALTLFYYWFIQMSKVSFVYMDEFDAFYHFELAENIVNKLKQLTDTQIIMTTHNTDLLSNDLMRPDCYFWMDGMSIKALSQTTEKELRKAHNLQKIFKAGGFR